MQQIVNAAPTAGEGARLHRCLSAMVTAGIAAGQIAARAEQARAERDADTNPLALMFPSPRGAYWRSSNFDRRILAAAYRAAGWRDADGTWTWHSLRHVFCTAALFSWRLEATDVSCMAGHANVRVTLDMYVGATAGNPWTAPAQPPNSTLRRHQGLGARPRRP